MLNSGISPDNDVRRGFLRMQPLGETAAEERDALSWAEKRPVE
jgi:hypothetical protein